MPGSRPKFTEVEVRRLQDKVNRARAKKTGIKESLGLYDQVNEIEARLRKVEKKVREHETRLDNIMTRVYKLEME